MCGTCSSFVSASSYAIQPARFPGIEFTPVQLHAAESLPPVIECVSPHISGTVREATILGSKVLRLFLLTWEGAHGLKSLPPGSGSSSFDPSEVTFVGRGVQGLADSISNLAQSQRDRRIGLCRSSQRNDA